MTATQISIPSPPQLFQLSTTPTSLNFSVNLGYSHGSAFTSIELQRSLIEPNGENTWQLLSVTNKLQEAEINQELIKKRVFYVFQSDLDPGNMLWFRARSSNGVGSSYWSEILFIETNSTEPSQPILLEPMTFPQYEENYHRKVKVIINFNYYIILCLLILIRFHT